MTGATHPSGPVPSPDWVHSAFLEIPTRVGTHRSGPAPRQPFGYRRLIGLLGTVDPWFVIGLCQSLCGYTFMITIYCDLNLKHSRSGLRFSTPVISLLGLSISWGPNPRWHPSQWAWTACFGHNAIIINMRPRWTSLFYSTA